MWEVIIGAIISILITIFIAYLQKPKLMFGKIYNKTFHYTTDTPAKIARHITIEIINQALPPWLRWLQRSTASMVRAEIEFYNKNGKPLFPKSMTARWAGSDQPVTSRIFIEDHQGYIVDYAKLKSIDYYIIYPGKNEEIDIAARFDQDLDYYGWNNDNYFCNPMWRNTERKIPTGDYYINITLFHAGEKKSKLFMFDNPVDEKNYSLKPSINQIDIFTLIK